MNPQTPGTGSPVDGTPEKWTPQKLPTTGVHTATFSLPVPLLKKIEEEVSRDRLAGYNRSKSGLVAEALEMYFSRNK